MSQTIKNEGSVNQQINIKEQYLPSRSTRFSRRFDRLNIEVSSNTRYKDIMDDLRRYLTKLDGVGLEKKMEDGGFSIEEIIKATRRKENYRKKLEKNKFYESARWINSQIFAQILINFESYVEPLISQEKSKDEIRKSILSNIITPILKLLNEEGENDEILNYNAEDVYGMIYFLTGQCHINWKNYEDL